MSSLKASQHIDAGDGANHRLQKQGGDPWHAKAWPTNADRRQDNANCSAGISNALAQSRTVATDVSDKRSAASGFLNMAVPPEDGNILVYHPESRPQAWREIETLAIMRLMLLGLKPRQSIIAGRHQDECFGVAHFMHLTTPPRDLGHFKRCGGVVRGCGEKEIKVPTLKPAPVHGCDDTAMNSAQKKPAKA